MKVLAVKVRRLGDTVLWTGALEALSQWSEVKELDIAYPASYAALFSGDPRFCRQFPLRSSLADNRVELFRMRKMRYDVVLNFHASPSSLLISLLAGAKERIIHHHSRIPRNFFSQRRIVDLGKAMPATERDLNVVRTLGWSGKSPATAIRATADNRKRGQFRLKEAGITGERPVVTLSISASRPAKQWPTERYVKLCSLLKEKADLAIVYDSETLSSAHGRLSTELQTLARPILTTALEDLMGVLSQTACFVGGDSGVKHLAAALGIPTVSIFGPESLGEWHCYESSRHRALQQPVLCRDNDAYDPRFAWCGASLCPLSSHACVNLVMPNEVAAAVIELL